MRSVVRLRTRPGRPIWQLTTRPSTAAVLALVSLAAAGAQLALLSSPTPWYQVAVVAFWVVVGVAFVVSALGTRTRARRQAEAVAARPAVDPMPFVPVPVRPARPRRRDTAAGETAVAEAGEPTDPVGTPRTATLRPSPSPSPHPAPATATERTAVADRPRPTPRPGRRPVVTDRREHITSAPRPARSWRPSREPEERTTTVAVTSRYAVRAVAAATSASQEMSVPAETGGGRRDTSRRALTAETVAIRDGRVRPRAHARSGAADDQATERPSSERPSSERPSTSPRPVSGGRRRLADESRAASPSRRGGAAPSGAVPSPRQAPSEERPAPRVERPSRSNAPREERPAAAERSAGAPPTDRSGRPRAGGTGSAVPRPVVHARSGAAEERDGSHARRRSDGPLVATPTAEARAPRRREGPPVSTETTAPFGGAMTFGGRAVPAEPAPESWAPAPRGPVPGPATGRHAALTAAPVDGVPRGAAARHAVAADSGRRRSGRMS